MLAEPSMSGSIGTGSGEVLLQEDNNISETLFKNSGKTSTKHRPDVINETVRHQIVSYAYKYKDMKTALSTEIVIVTSRGFPFQGDSTEIEDVPNGNFLGTLELLGKYNEITRDHLTKGPSITREKHER
ncbi:hypothetical protein PR048_015939 [Dryococelus australis]|uniref:Uncharacterized protein n=1 Tax=Dryococelus australis TaxID=614101 RepID=A0ABQ9HIC5_9NEOP|nr:hypothetical protein PR048_015939 [Dryococelus australis]